MVQHTLIPRTATLLGLTVSRASFTSRHIKRICNLAKLELSKLYSLQGLNSKCKKILVNSLIISRLTYPITPLNTASLSGITKLQSIQNRALKFILKARWQDMLTAKELHIRSKMTPLNQIIHRRSKDVWDKIMSGTAADLNIATEIIRIPYSAPKKRFPSSYERSRKRLPPPIYTGHTILNPNIISYYAS